MYLWSLYVVVYDASFNFEVPSAIYTYVDVIQLIDIVSTFFIAVRVRELSEFVQRYRAT